jgi:outer membrane protein OmpA-like peptidoglycan-associated protein
MLEQIMDRIIIAAAFLIALQSGASADGTKTYEIQQPKGTWQVPGEIKTPTGPWQNPGAIQAPTAPVQTPGEIGKATAPIQEPGPIQVPKGIVEIRRVPSNSCEQRLAVVADALFDFDRAELRPDAAETLAALGPAIGKTGGRAVAVEGHTDAKGSDADNLKLSEARARTVRDWLAGHGLAAGDLEIRPFGKARPIAPNENADGSDNPEGRQKNRRVEVVVATCG